MRIPARSAGIPSEAPSFLDANDRAWIDTLDPATLCDEGTRILSAWYADVATVSERS